MKTIRARILPYLLFCGLLALPQAFHQVAQAQSAQPATSPVRYEVAIQTGVPVKMRDGVTLIADIYRPKAQGKFPVLLTRTPYNRRDPMTGTFLASHGYVAILQDTRGRFDSGGEFYPFQHESNDGYDTIEWAAALDASNGMVGMFGGSYVGATQMLAAIAKPPHLKAIFPYVTASEYYDGWSYQNGAWMQAFSSTWTTGLAQDTLRRKAAGMSNFGEWMKQLPVEDYKLNRAADCRRCRALLSRLDRTRTQRRILEALEDFGSLLGTRHQGAAFGRLARHLFERLHRQLRRDAKERSNTGSARQSAVAGRPVGARGDFGGRQNWRRDLRQTSRAGYERHDCEVDGLRAERRQKRIRLGFAGADFRDG